MSDFDRYVLPVIKYSLVKMCMITIKASLHKKNYISKVTKISLWTNIECSMNTRRIFHSSWKSPDWEEESNHTV